MSGKLMVSAAAVILAVDLVLHSEDQPHTHVETAQVEQVRETNLSGFLSTALFVSVEIPRDLKLKTTS